MPVFLYNSDMHLTLHLTDRCNLACRYCYARHGTVEMSFETAMTAIAECTADDPNPGIIFFGGEPLLQADLIFLIPFADKLAAKLYAERNALFIQRHYNPAFPIVSILEDMPG